ncbi:C40 family peptidase [Nitrogeniibacter mangrovi]|uniref:C40 family peptidase n=1 Tax=Nitrogeniibacter mangrovi TaxID=2016596 RepID=A0A6C1B7A9_9RHOO|nr:C40 family peptidase [Nitrogeniibacter mangrovi]QID18124.1 C40 family peptidase [Nitrogeniibacter mangrovi]
MPVLARAQSAPPADVPVAELDPNTHPSRRPPGDEVVMRSLSFLDTPYRYGGTSRATGLDCSALVQKVFAEAVGMQLPRTARAQAGAGKHVSRKALRPGDLVFFNTRHRAYSHVGIYLGNDRFVHAPSKGSVVRIEHLSVRYWSRRFNGARRLINPPTQLSAVSDQ